MVPQAFHSLSVFNYWQILFLEKCTAKNVKHFVIQSLLLNITFEKTKKESHHTIPS